jgi:hypothetical protein
MLNYMYPKFQKPWIETTDKIRWTRQQRDACVANLHEPEAAFLYGKTITESTIFKIPTPKNI